MSSLKSAVLFSLFSGVSFADIQRAGRQHRESGSAGQYPDARDIAYAARFSAPAQTVASSFEDEHAGDAAEAEAATRRAA